MNAGEYHLPFDRLRRNALFAGGAGLVLSLVVARAESNDLSFTPISSRLSSGSDLPLGCLALLDECTTSPAAAGGS